MDITPSTDKQPDAVPSGYEIIPEHPLAAIAGKFDGEVWEATLEEIQRLRRMDRQQWQHEVEIDRDAG